MPTTILICGSPADGFDIIGLFADAGDAESYAEDHSLKDWWIARLISPEAFADRHWKRLRAAHGGHREIDRERQSDDADYEDEKGVGHGW